MQNIYKDLFLLEDEQEEQDKDLILDMLDSLTHFYVEDEDEQSRKVPWYCMLDSVASDFGYSHKEMSDFAKKNGYIVFKISPIGSFEGGVAIADKDVNFDDIKENIRHSIIDDFDNEKDIPEVKITMREDESLKEDKESKKIVCFVNNYQYGENRFEKMRKQYGYDEELLDKNHHLVWLELSNDEVDYVKNLLRNDKHDNVMNANNFSKKGWIAQFKQRLSKDESFKKESLNGDLKPWYLQQGENGEPEYLGFAKSQNDMIDKMVKDHRSNYIYENTYIDELDKDTYFYMKEQGNFSEDEIAELDKYFDLEESLKESEGKFIKCPDEELERLEKELDEMGFKVVSTHQGWDETEVHYQIITKEGNQDEDTYNEYLDKFEELLDRFEEETGAPCTFNMGLQYDGYISCGFDVRAIYCVPGEDRVPGKGSIKLRFKNGKPADDYTKLQIKDIAKHMNMKDDDVVNMFPVDEGLEDMQIASKHHLVNVVNKNSPEHYKGREIIAQKLFRSRKEVDDFIDKYNDVLFDMRIDTDEYAKLKNGKDFIGTIYTVIIDKVNEEVFKGNPYDPEYLPDEGLSQDELEKIFNANHNATKLDYYKALTTKGVKGKDAEKIINKFLDNKALYDYEDRFIKDKSVENAELSLYKASTPHSLIVAWNKIQSLYDLGNIDDDKMSDLNKLYYEKEKKIMLGESMIKSNSSRLLGVLGIPVNTLHAILSSNTDGRKILDNDAFENAKNKIEKGIKAEGMWKNIPQPDSFIIEATLDEAKKLAKDLCQKEFITLKFSDENNFVSKLYRTNKKDYSNYIEKESSSKVVFDNDAQGLDGYTIVKGTCFSFGLYGNDNKDAFKNLTESKEDEDIEDKYFVCSIYGGYNCQELLADDIEVYAKDEEKAKKEAIKIYKQEYNYNREDNPFGLEAKINSDDEDELEEDIEKHDTLNDKLFENNDLKQDVKEAIRNIAGTFIDELQEDGIALTLKDIILVGSNVSYNYTKDSDLDIHLIVDSKALDMPKELVDKLYSAYRSIFNKNYDITIKGIPAEIYVELDDMGSAKSNGIYSLNNGWLKEPVQQDIPELDKDAFDSLFNEWQDKYAQLINKEDLTSEEVKKFIEDLYMLRKEGIANEGEYAIGNLVFKEFRNLGQLDDLKELRKELKGKELSLEQLDNNVKEEYNDNMSNSTLKENNNMSLEELNELVEKLYEHLKEFNVHYEMWPEDDDTINAEILWGDWKHDHLWFDYEAEKFLNSLGYDVVNTNVDVTEEDGSDSYSAIHSLQLRKKANEDLNEGKEELDALIEDSYNACCGKHLEHEFPSVDDVWQDLENNYDNHEVVVDLFKLDTPEDNQKLYKILESALYRLNVPFYTYDADDNLIPVNESLKEKVLSKGEQIARLVAKGMGGQSGPFGGNDPDLEGNELTLKSQGYPCTYRFNDDGSVDDISFEGMDEDDITDLFMREYSIDDEEARDYAQNLITHYTSFEDLCSGYDSWFVYFEEENPKLYKQICKLGNK